MKTFLRENPTLAFGLGLPVLLVVLFLLVSGIPSLFVGPPQYDVLYATGYNNYQNPLHISVVDEEVQVIYRPIESYGQVPRVWRYAAETGGVKEVPIILPADAKRVKPNSIEGDDYIPITVLPVQELAGLRVDSSSIAPDGYEFRGGQLSSRNAFTGWFRASRRHQRAALVKSGRSIRLPSAPNPYYGHGIHFIGWVVPES
ncbi:MAG: hypothetical protein HKN50_06620 [Gammaproteobacteria bacterium]|nr:hypothetical protein [Gammaproteobacteria bacterium]